MQKTRTADAQRPVGRQLSVHKLLQLARHIVLFVLLEMLDNDVQAVSERAVLERKESVLIVLEFVVANAVLVVDTENKILAVGLFHAIRRIVADQKRALISKEKVNSLRLNFSSTTTTQYLSYFIL